MELKSWLSFAEGALGVLAAKSLTWRVFSLVVAKAGAAQTTVASPKTEMPARNDPVTNSLSWPASANPSKLAPLIEAAPLRFADERLLSLPFFGHLG